MNALRHFLIRMQTSERGSISLEYILFIVAIAAISTGVLAFYTNIGNWFSTLTLPTQPTL